MRIWMKAASLALVAAAAIGTASAGDGDNQGENEGGNVENHDGPRAVPDGWMTVQLLGGSFAALEMVRRKLKRR